MSPPRPLPLAFSCLKHSLRKVIWIASKIKQGGEEEKKKAPQTQQPSKPFHLLFTKLIVMLHSGCLPSLGK